MATWTSTQDKAQHLAAGLALVTEGGDRVRVALTAAGWEALINDVRASPHPHRFPTRAIREAVAIFDTLTHDETEASL